MLQEEYSSAVGTSNAEGDYSIALGGSSALGVLSTAMGYTSSSFFSTSIGTLNIGGGSSNTWIETDPLFEIGNSNDPNNRSNALTVLKNGNVGIGTSYPTHKLEVRGTDGAAAISCQSDISWGIVGQTSGAGVAGVKGKTGAGGNSCIGVMGMILGGGLACKGLRYNWICWLF